MKYNAVIGGRTVEIERLGADHYKVNGVEKKLDVVSFGTGLYSIIMDGASYEVSVRDEKKSTIVEFGAHSISVKLEDPFKSKGAGGKDALEGEAVISSPMPGRVVSLKVEVGQVVEEGQGVVVVEAMKMENELQAPKAGKVTKVEVKIGDAVESGQDLVTIE